MFYAVPRIVGEVARMRDSIPLGMVNSPYHECNRMLKILAANLIKFRTSARISHPNKLAHRRFVCD